MKLRLKHRDQSQQPVEGVKSDKSAFIIRIFKETGDDASQVVTWHGSIDHVGTNKRLYFDDMESMIQFIQEQIGLHRRRYPRWLNWILTKLGYES